MAEPHQWTFLEFRDIAQPGDPPWVGRWYPAPGRSEPLHTRPGHCLVITEVDWLSTGHGAVFMLEHWVADDEDSASPLLYGIGVGAEGQVVGQWRSTHGVMVPPGRELRPATPAFGSVVLVRGYWVLEAALLEPALQAQTPDQQVPMPQFPAPPQWPV